MDIFGNFSVLLGDRNKRYSKTKKEENFVYTDTSLEPIAEIENKQQFFSIFAVKVFLILLFCVLIVRLFVMQVVQGESNQKLAEGNRIRPRIVDATRGVITDKNGVWLARNKPNFTLGVYPSDLPKKKSDRVDIYNKLSQIVGVSSDEIQKEAEANGLFSFDLVTLKENIPHDDALVLEKKVAGFSGVTISDGSSREYVSIPGLSFVLGYTGKISPDQIASGGNEYYLSDHVGKTGLESEYEAYLKGIHGEELIEKDSRGNILRVLQQEGYQEPVPGDNLSLYLDSGLEQEVAKALENGITNAKTTTGDQSVSAGVAAVMDVHTGGILAMVSLPSYDNNLFSVPVSPADFQTLSNDKTYPMLNRAIAGIYPPGSISKIILASAGLSEGNITVNTSFTTPSAIKIGDYTFPDWKDHSYESTNVERAIAESNDVFFYSVGGGYDKISGLGIDKIKKYWQIFGLGEKTGIDLPGEASGLLPDDAWKKKVKNEPWYIGDTYHVAIGQGDLLVTPIQMLRATAAIANGGTLLEPQLVQKITDQKGNVVQEFGPRVENQQVVSPSIIKIVQEGMRLTVTGGTAQNLKDLPVSVAGKTGTAQFLNNAKTHAWFECYAPYENPQIAVIAMVEGGGESYDIANPIVKEILNYYFTR